MSSSKSTAGGDFSPFLALPSVSETNDTSCAASSVMHSAAQTKYESIYSHIYKQIDSIKRAKLEDELSLAETNEQARKFKEENYELLQRESIYKDEIEMLRSELKRMKKFNVESLDRLEFLTNGCKGLQEILKKIQQQVLYYEETDKLININNENNLKKIEECEKRFESFKEEMARLAENTKSKHEIEIQDYQRQIEQHKIEIKAKSQALNDFSAEALAKKEKIDLMAAEEKRLLGKIAQLEQNVENGVENLKQEQEKTESNQKQISLLESEIIKLKACIIEKENTETTLRSTIDNMDKAMSELKNTSGKLEEDLNKKDEQIKALNEKIQLNQVDLEIKLQEVTDHQINNDSLINELKAENKNLDEKYKQQLQITNKLNEDVLNTISKNKAYQAQLQEKIREIHDLKNSMREMTNDLELSKQDVILKSRELETALEEIGSLKIRLEESTMNNDCLSKGEVAVLNPQPQSVTEVHHVSSLKRQNSNNLMTSKSPIRLATVLGETESSSNSSCSEIPSHQMPSNIATKTSTLEKNTSANLCDEQTLLDETLASDKSSSKRDSTTATMAKQYDEPEMARENANESKLPSTNDDYLDAYEKARQKCMASLASIKGKTAAIKSRSPANKGSRNALQFVDFNKAGSAVKSGKENSKLTKQGSMKKSSENGENDENDFFNLANF